MTLAAFTSTDKSLKSFDELMSTPIHFSAYILNGLKIKNLTQEILLGPAFRLLKGDDYPFDLSKPLPLVTSGNRQRVPVDYFINNDLKYLQGGVSTMTYMTSTTKTKAANYDLPGIEDMVPNIWSLIKEWLMNQHVTHVNVVRKHGYGYLEEIIVRRADNDLYRFKEGYFPRLRINDIEDMLRSCGSESAHKSFSQNWRDLPRDIPLDSVEVLSEDNEIRQIGSVDSNEYQKQSSNYR
ncbi:hypothetical protein Tco_0857218 [Tanacetum coccineum]|uniref:Uncharacterized protein n=1 Tax=Tanacetum coccineum TaxID=301880 RepID=A0ABQ5B5K2_9ASTR